MKSPELADLQTSIRDTSAFGCLDDFFLLGRTFLQFVEKHTPTRIVSPSHPNYVFFQYGADYGHKITRPLNTGLYILSASELERAFGRFAAFLDDLRVYQEQASDRPGNDKYLESGEIHKVVYTVQQSIGCVGDSFDNPNQSRKRVGQLFETLIKLVIQASGSTRRSRQTISWVTQ